VLNGRIFNLHIDLEMGHFLQKKSSTNQPYSEKKDFTVKQISYLINKHSIVSLKANVKYKQKLLPCGSREPICLEKWSWSWVQILLLVTPQ